MLVTSGSLALAILGQLLFVVPLCIYGGGCYTFFVEIFTTRTRFTSAAISYNVAYAALRRHGTVHRHRAGRRHRQCPTRPASTWPPPPLVVPASWCSDQGPRDPRPHGLMPASPLLATALPRSSA